MDTQLAGFLSLLLGMAALFGLWALAIKDRSKTIESDVPTETPSPPPQGHLGSRGYSLAPVAQTPPGRQAEARVQRSPTLSNGHQPAEPVDGEIECELPDDELACTHLEIAQQFFQLSDFEGAAEMAKLVVDNANASPTQIAAAQKLQSDCG